MSDEAATTGPWGTWRIGIWVAIWLFVLASIVLIIIGGVNYAVLLIFVFGIGVTVILYMQSRRGTK